MGSWVHKGATVYDEGRRGFVEFGGECAEWFVESSGPEEYYFESGPETGVFYATLEDLADAFIALAATTDGQVQG